MKEKNNIDKLFKDRLKEDNPSFKEEYWQAFEKMLPPVPAAPAPVSAPAGSLSKILSAFTVTKGVVAIVGLALVSSIIYYVARPTQKNKPNENTVVAVVDSSLKSTSAEKTATVVSPNLQTTDRTTHNSEPKTSIKDKASGPMKKLSGEDAKRTNNNTTALKALSDLKNNIVNVQEADNLSNPPQSSTLTQNSDRVEAQQQPSLIARNSTSEQKPEEKTSSALVMEPPSAANKSENGETPGTEPLKLSNNELKAKDTINYDSLVGVIGTGPQAKGKTLGSNAPSSKLGLYVVPGVVFCNTLGNATGFNSAIKPAFQFGAGISYQLNPSILIYTELNTFRTTGNSLVKSSSKTEYLFSPWQNTTTVENREMVVMNVPLLLRYQYKKHAAGIGPTFRYLMYSSGEKIIQDSTALMTNYDNSKADNYLQGFNRFQTGIALEYSWNFYRQHAILFRYSYMLGELGKQAYYSGLKKDNLNMLNIALRFRIY